MNNKLKENFYGMRELYKKAAENINMIKNNTDYSPEGKKNKIIAIRNEFYSDYKQRINKARTEGQELITKAVKNNRASKFKKSENVTLDIERFRQLESMGIGALADYLSKDNNVYNEVFMELFELKADYYINNFDFKKDTGYDQIKALKDELNGVNCEEVKVLNEDLLRLNNAESSMDIYDNMDLILEDEYINVRNTFFTDEEIKTKAIGSYTSNKVINAPGEKNNSFEFNFAGVRPRE